MKKDPIYKKVFGESSDEESGDESGLFAPLEIDSEDEPLANRKKPPEDSEEDEPLRKRRKQPALQTARDFGDEALRAALEMKIENAGVKDLPREKFVARAYSYRERAKAIFEAECQRQMRSASPAQKEGLLAALMNGLNFDKGSRRRGVCKFRCRGKSKEVVTSSICVLFSARLVDFGCSVNELLMLARHELSHAANPGSHHNSVWAAYNLSVGGDGKRCDSSEVTKSTLGHRVQLYCEAIGAANGLKSIDESLAENSRHFFKKRQVAPNAAFLRGKRCKACRKNGLSGRLFWRRVSLADTASIQ